MENPSDTNMKPRFWTVVGMIAMAAVARIMPHPWNVTPVPAIALFGGAKFDDKRTAFWVPLAAMLAGDIFVGFHVLLPLVYACFAATVAIGFWIKKKPGVGRLVAGSLAASLLLYVVSDAGMWVISPLYPKTLQGLVMCYAAALP